MTQTAARSPPLSPRRRIASLFGAALRTGSPASPSPSPSPLLSGEQDAPLPLASTSPDPLQLGPVACLASLLKTGERAGIRSSKRRTSYAGASPHTDISHLELSSTSSHTNSTSTTVTAAEHSRAAPSQIPSYPLPRPTSPAKPTFLRGHPSTFNSSASVSPPISPTKRAGAFLFSRSRRDSNISTSTKESRRDETAGSGASTSRSNSPTKREREQSASPTKRRTITKSMIGLPTDFKHTSGGSSAPLQSALQLAGLAAVEGQSAVNTNRAPLTPHSRAGPQIPEISEGTLSETPADRSFSLALAKIETALSGSSIDVPLRPLRRSSSPSSWNQNNRMETVKEVPSGFIQRFEKAGESVPIVGGGEADPPKAGSSETGHNITDHQCVSGDPTSTASPSRPPRSLLTSPSGSPGKALRRKPVPKIEQDETHLAPQGASHSVSFPVGTEDSSDSTTTEQESPKKTLHKTSSSVSVRSQEWSATLAEINAALKA